MSLLNETVCCHAGVNNLRMKCVIYVLHSMDANHRDTHMIHFSFVSIIPSIGSVNELISRNVTLIVEEIAHACINANSSCCNKLLINKQFKEWNGTPGTS